MNEIAVRQLNQDTAGVLARVKRGEEINVTERGVVIARLVPAQGHPLGDLVAAGRLQLPTLRGPSPRPAGSVRTDVDSAAVLSDMRDDERY